MFSPEEYNAIYLSFKVAALSVIISMPLALWLGYVLARKNFKGKVLLESFLHLPLVMPPVTTGFILLLLLGRQGIIGSFLYEAFNIRIAFSFYAAIIASLTVSFPLFVRAVKSSIQMVDKSLEQASFTLGKSRFYTLIHVTYPLALPGILSGFVLSFARSLGEFGATITFAGNIENETQTLPLAIYSYMQQPGKENSAFILVGVSIAISMVAVIISEIIIKKMRTS